MKELFPPLSAGAGHALEEFQTALDTALPLKAAHRRTLPLAVRELSLRLTRERSGSAYWSEPRLVSAYLRWFLPWNLLRLTRLLSAVDLPPPFTVTGERPALLDIGSGPLTLPMALWLARPEWRNIPLDLVCADASPRMPELGRVIFDAMRKGTGAWRILPRRAPPDTPRRFWLTGVVNALNEICTGRGADTGMRLAAFMKQAARLTAPGGAVLCVEPGTRLGGKIVQSLRERAATTGFDAVSPCPHRGPCPLHGTRFWCHFTFDSQGAPKQLLRLARETKLPKKNLSLSFLLLHRRHSGQESAPSVKPNKSGPMPARVLSAPLPMPGSAGACYACGERGLLLLTGESIPPSGALTKAILHESGRRDAKSGAWISLLPKQD